MPTGHCAHAPLQNARRLPKQEAEQVAQRLMADEKAALDATVREELGLDPSRTAVGGYATNHLPFGPSPHLTRAFAPPRRTARTFRSEACLQAPAQRVVSAPIRGSFSRHETYGPGGSEIRR